MIPAFCMPDREKRKRKYIRSCFSSAISRAGGLQEASCRRPGKQLIRQAAGSGSFFGRAAADRKKPYCPFSGKKEGSTTIFAYENKP